MPKRTDLDEDDWAAIHAETGLPCGIASMKHYTFHEAVRDFKPCEVRRMRRGDIFDGMKRFEEWQKAQEAARPKQADLLGEES